MATTLAKRSKRGAIESNLAEEFAEPLIPYPGRRVRYALIAGLLIWQVAVLWIYPFVGSDFWMSFSNPQNADPYGYYSLRWRPPSPLIVEAISGGLLFAICGNAAFLFAKAPWHWPVRGMVGAFLVAASAFGYLSAFDGWSMMSASSYYPVFMGISVVVVASLAWTLVPALRDLELVHRDDLPVKQFTPSSQFGLIHLLLLMAISGCLVAMYQWVGGVRLHFFFSGLPANYQLAIVEMILLASVVALSTIFLCVGANRLWWMILAFVAPGLGIVASLVLFENTHGMGVPVGFYDLLLGIETAFLGGSALALRLLGFRLIRA